MITDLKPYPEYKESGLPWLGQVPGNWSFERTKWRFRTRKELNSSGAHTNILSLTLRGVVNNNPDDPEGLVPKDYRTYQFFAKGDLVFKLIDLENLRTSRVGLVHEDGIMSSAYVRLAPSSPTNIRYFFHQFYDLYSRGIYNQLGAGVRSTLGPSDLLNVGIAVPQPAEQAAIVRFLDWANGRLERAIRAKRKVIALLNEQKQAIIHRAVTRGLDPSVPLKPSGVPWLGDIPQHWEVGALGRLCTARCDGPFGSGLKSMHYTDSGARVIRLQNIGNGEFRDRGLAFISEEYCATLGDHGVLEGDLLVAGLGDEKIPAGRACIAPPLLGLAMVKADCFRFRLRAGRAVPAFLSKHLSATASAATACLSTGATRLRINLSAAAARAVALPTVEEQQHIIDFIGSSDAPLDTAISRLEREIELLREYRTRLVADVVTGKLDVREAAARLPKGAEGPEPLDETDSLTDIDDAAEVDPAAVPEEAGA